MISQVTIPEIFQFWRMFGCVFFMGKLGFPFLINVYFLYSYSLRLETGNTILELFKKSYDELFM